MTLVEICSWFPYSSIVSSGITRPLPPGAAKSVMRDALVVMWNMTVNNYSVF
jgi:hypothetical protein